jgi:hypothetical protein
MHHVIRTDGRTVLNICACGKLHFTHGPVTLHFEHEEFAAFAAAVAHLAANFSLVQADRRSVPAPPHTDTLCH